MEKVLDCCFRTLEGNHNFISCVRSILKEATWIWSCITSQSHRAFSGAQILITSCPFCIGNLKDAYEKMEPEIKEKIQVIDVIDFIASKI